MSHDDAARSYLQTDTGLIGSPSRALLAAFRLALVWQCGAEWRLSTQHLEFSKTVIAKRAEIADRFIVLSDKRADGATSK